MMVTAGADRLNHLHVFVYLAPLEERTVSQDQVAAQSREVLARYPGLTPIVNARSALGNAGGKAAAAARNHGEHDRPGTRGCPTTR